MSNTTFELTEELHIGDYEAKPISPGLRRHFPVGYAHLGTERRRKPFPWLVLLFAGAAVALLGAS